MYEKGEWLEDLTKTMMIPQRKPNATGLWRSSDSQTNYIHVRDHVESIDNMDGSKS